MNNIKNQEIYRMAFELAVRVYRVNMALPAYRLIKEGLRLRRSSIRVKDALSEAFSVINSNKPDSREEYLRLMILAQTSCNETLSQLRQIKGISYTEEAVTEIAAVYKSLKRKINKHIQDTEPEGNMITIPFPAMQNTEHLTVI